MARVAAPRMIARVHDILSYSHHDDFEKTAFVRVKFFDVHAFSLSAEKKVSCMAQVATPRMIPRMRSPLFFILTHDDFESKMFFCISL